MRRVAVGLFVVAVCIGAATQPAAAHALLDRSDPAAGSAVATSPKEVLLHFTEPPDPGLLTVHVLDGSGHDAESSPAKVDPADAKTVHVAVPMLANGTYTVTWRTTSAADGHTTAGSFAFGVGQPPAAPAAGSNVPTITSPPNTVLGSSGRTFIYIGLALLLGAVVVTFGLVLAARLYPSRIAMGLSWLVAVLGALALLADEVHQSGASYSTFLSSTPGRHLLALFVGLLATACGVAAYALRRSRITLALIGVFAAGTMFVRIEGGHAAGENSAWFSEGSQWLHFVAVGAWIGALPWFLATLIRADAWERGRVARRFAVLATVGLIVVAFTGVLRAYDEVGAWSAFTDTTFGKTLLVKLGLFTLLIAVGALNHFGFVRRAYDRPRHLKLSTTVEIGIGAIILAVTGVLTGLAPSSSLAIVPSRPSGPPPMVLEASDYATTVSVRLTITPGNVGSNKFETRVTEYGTDQPAQANGVSLRFTLPSRTDIAKSTLVLQPAGNDGTWAADGTNLSVIGVWNVTAVITRSAGGVEVPFTVKARPQGAQVTTVPGPPTLYDVTDASGNQVQSYLDPGSAGANEVHATFFKPDGNELEISSVAMAATSPDGRTTELAPRRLDPGHFVADAPITNGTWTFTVDAVPASGGSVSALIDIPVPTEAPR